VPAHQVTISVDGTSHNIVPGLVQGNTLHALAPLCPSDQLLFEVDGDIDIPVSPTDLIVLKGGEVFSIGDGCPRISDNPTVRKDVNLVVNNQACAPVAHSHHAKLTGAEIKVRAGIQQGDELWIDLKGLADERVNDAQRLIMREGYTFFARAADHDEGEECCSHGRASVLVTVNGNSHTIQVGKYTVTDLKLRFGVPADYEFDQVTDGKFTGLGNEVIVSICGGEVFVSHVRQGASS